jgi:catechol 2,3-dioxygenase-like lactoylglutathione lyase family enzyme
MTIPARISIITLGAHDLEKLRAFYLGLGWRERTHYPDFSMFEMGGGWLALYPFDKLAEDGHVAAGAGGVPRLRHRAECRDRRPR